MELNAKNAYDLYFQICYMKKYKEMCHEEIPMNDLISITGSILYRMKDELICEGTSSLKEYFESFSKNTGDDGVNWEFHGFFMYQSTLDAFVLLDGLDSIINGNKPVFFTNPEVFNLLYSGRSINGIKLNTDLEEEV